MKKEYYIFPWNIAQPYTFVCVCGCLNKVVTPLSPTDWKMTFDGKCISLYPSVGNWSFDCQSHYWIKKGKVEWSGSWSIDHIINGRQADKKSKEEYYESKTDEKVLPEVQKKKSIWNRFLQIMNL